MKRMALVSGIVFFLIMFSVSRCKTGDLASVKSDADPELLAAKAAIDIVRKERPLSSTPGRSVSLCAGSCHWHGDVINAEKFLEWGNATIAINKCFTSATNPGAKVNCMRRDTDPNEWEGKKLGFYRAVAHTKFFDDLLRQGMNADVENKIASFKKKMIMPAADRQGEHPPISMEEFDRLLTWVLGGMRKRVEAFGETIDGPNATTCDAYTSPELREHITEATNNGWGYKNIYNDEIKMFACPPRPTQRAYDFAADPLDCFKGSIDGQTFPLVHTFREPAAPAAETISLLGSTWAETITPTGQLLKQKMRLLRPLDFRTTYWIRSSADGRFVASGVRARDASTTLPNLSDGGIADLQFRPENGGTIGINAPYDPGFFPDNQGFTYMTSSAWFCSLKLLLNPPIVDGRKFIELEKQKDKLCYADASMGVYQHVGRPSVLGDDDPATLPYWVVRSDQYTNDDGAYGIQTDPSVAGFYKQGVVLQVYGMKEDKKDGRDTFKTDPAINISTPYKSDWGISPNGAVLTARAATKKPSAASPSQLGYSLNMFKDPRSPAQGVKEVGRICMKGGKATMSFNDRVFATHHYTDATDWSELGYPDPSNTATDNPQQKAKIGEFNKLVGKSSNIYIHDILKGQTLRLTRTRPGQFALYPHFRSDGWIYFVIRDVNFKKDYLVATDAAIRLMAEP